MPELSRYPCITALVTGFGDGEANVVDGRTLHPVCGGEPRDVGTDTPDRDWRRGVAAIEDVRDVLQGKSYPLCSQITRIRGGT